MKRNKVLLFIAGTYIFTWSIEIPAALSKHGISTINVSHGLQTLASFAPGIIAILLSIVYGGGKSLKQFFLRLFRIKVSFSYYLFTIFSGIIISGLSLWIFNWIFKNNILPDPISNLFFYFLLFFFFSPLWEELGWRGYLLPELQKDFSPLKSSLIIGFIWGLWHMPIYLAINPYGDQTFKFFIFIFVGCFPMSVIQTWIYNSTKGGLLLCILFHNGVNVGATYFFSNIKGNEMRPFEISVLLFILLAGLLLYRTKNKLGIERTL